jgi:hypothetical protein
VWAQLLTNFTADHERAALALEGKGVANTPGLDPLGLAGGYGTLAPTGGRSDTWAAEIEALQLQIAREDYRLGGEVGVVAGGRVHRKGPCRSPVADAILLSGQM